MMHRAHKIRLNPTPEQEIYFRQACGTARFCFNWGLAELKRALDEGRTPDRVLDLKKRFNAIRREQFPWTYEVTKCAVEGAFRNLESALVTFWHSKHGDRKGRRVNFPRFKTKRHGYGSCYLSNDKFSVQGHWLAVPKLGRVNMTEALRFAGKILGATVSHHAGWWWVSIQMEMPVEAPIHEGHPIGVDVGIEYAAVDSDGERLNVTGMLKNRRLAFSLSDAALSEIHRQLRYKSVCFGGQVVVIDPFFPSSQIHHDCGYRYRALTLGQRLWICPHCGARVDRDLNAAKNIRDEALRMSAVPVVATSAREWPVDGMSDLPRKAVPDEAGMDKYVSVLRK